MTRWRPSLRSCSIGANRRQQSFASPRAPHPARGWRRAQLSKALCQQGTTSMKTRAAVAVEKGKPLEILEVDLDGPKAGEVLVEIKATGICHTDEFTLSGADPEGLFPAILG